MWILGLTRSLLVFATKAFLYFSFSFPFGYFTHIYTILCIYVYTRFPDRRAFGIRSVDKYTSRSMAYDIAFLTRSCL